MGACRSGANYGKKRYKNTTSIHVHQSQTIRVPLWHKTLCAGADISAKCEVMLQFVRMSQSSG